MVFIYGTREKSVYQMFIFSCSVDDQRPEFALDDASCLVLSGLNAEINSDAKFPIDISQSNDIYVENSKANGKGKIFVKVNDSLSINIYLSGNDFRNFEKPDVQKKDGQIILTSNISK